MAFDDPWRLGALGLAVALFAASELLYPRRSPRAHRARDRYTSEALVMVPLANALLAPWLMSSGLGHWPGLEAAWGLGLAGLGTALRFAAIVTLGRFFTSAVSIEAGHAVVRGGPYRWVRHPGYAGALLFGFGLALALGNWLLALIFMVSYGLAVLWRVRAEEAALLEALGADYAAYAATVRWRLLPGVF